ncbi:ATP-binding protein [Flavobacterium sp. NRK F10]|uniref:ATP-binding response regulator n=1 Tax=Flavobacterium sp. NRK F10 TaxID=2954931 RepID=UPI0020908A28|nr:ATP-binding protein [Flavobacterium sp. NRK F10]MCO6176126.1 ATP-binding protein [Flavobacterium sp. NRK F10]
MILKKIFPFLTLFCTILFFGQDTIQPKQELKKLLHDASVSFMDYKVETSMDCANKALVLALQYDEDEYAAKAYNIIGLNYTEFAELEKAVDFFNKGIIHASKTKNDTVKSWLYNNLGNVYCYHKIDYKKGIESYLKGLEFSKKFSDELEIAFSKLNLTSAYFTYGEFDKGIVFLNEAKDYVSQSDDLEANLTLNSLYGEYYSFYENFPKARAYFLKTAELCSKNTEEYLEGNIVEAYSNISDFYHKIGDDDNAYLFLEKHDSLEDKVYNKQRIQQVKSVGKEIENNEAKMQLVKMEAEKIVQDQKLRNTQVFIIALFLFFAFVFVLLLITVRNNKLRKKVNKKLLEINEELRIAKEKAEEASNVKSQFISTITHELRTPLYGVIGITDIIEEEHKELEGSTYLKSLKFSAKYLLSLVNDILNLNKIEENKVTLDNRTFHLKETLVTIKNSLETIARKNKNTIAIEIDEAIPECLYGDNVRLSQIIFNLMSNSLKFTQKGKVLIKAKLKKKRDTTLFIQFTVEDNGIGIPEKYQAKVFEKFVQIDRKDEDYQGTGLGLTIVERLVELFNGTISLESKEDQGTKVIFTIPLKEGQKEDATKKESIPVTREEKTTKEYYILVVEDNKINQLVTRHLLENNHFKCKIVDDGFTALESLEQEHFDAVLMDINMPKINGFEASKLIREKGFTLPIIAVTAFEKDEIMDKIHEAQINDIIVKPFDVKTFLKILQKQLDK